jgi:hypothetical protein
MKLRHALLAAGAVLAAPAYAAIANGTTGNGELFLSVYDAEAKISYTKDLGALQNDFFVDGQKEEGYTKSWSLDDQNWSAFLGKAKMSNLQWSVLASETTGGTAAGGARLFTTVRSGDESKVADFTNQLFTNAIGAAQMGTFFNAVNVSGTHGQPGTALDYSIHGNSVNADSDPGNAYFGSSGGTGPTLNGNAPFSNSNAMGTESFFYYLTRSGTNQLGKVLVDQFDNSAFKGVFQLSGSGFAPASLSARSLDTSVNGGYVLTYSLQPVPEPGSYALMLLGLGGLAAVARRRNAR